MTDELILLNEADKALALATSVTELKDLHAGFKAANAWAKARGLGIEAENKAAEYVLRSERKIGAELIRMLEAGERPGRGQYQHNKKGQFGTGDSNDDIFITLADMGIPRNEATHWQAIARVPEDTFEALLAHAREARERLAKVNFYRPERKAPRPVPTPGSPGFDLLRAGAYQLLSWSVDDQGVGGPTKNGLLDLPNDELLTLARIIQALVPAYREAKEARL